MIPMRDGIKLNTIVLMPLHSAEAFPFLLMRTPYGAGYNDVNDGDAVNMNTYRYSELAKGGYIFVLQDIRGKYKSEGTMQIHQPITHLKQPGTIDESTDTWDAIDWLIKNIKNNNGKAGIFGVSYPGLAGIGWCC